PGHVGIRREAGPRARPTSYSKRRTTGRLCGAAGAFRQAEARIDPAMMTRLRNYFLTGFIVTAPLAITASLAWSLIGWVDSWVKPYIPARYNPDTYLPFAVPGFGLIVAVVLIT